MVQYYPSTAVLRRARLCRTGSPRHQRSQPPCFTLNFPSCPRTVDILVRLPRNHHNRTENGKMVRWSLFRAPITHARRGYGAACTFQAAMDRCWCPWLQAFGINCINGKWSQYGIIHAVCTLQAQPMCMECPRREGEMLYFCKSRIRPSPKMENIWQLLQTAHRPRLAIVVNHCSGIWNFPGTRNHMGSFTNTSQTYHYRYLMYYWSVMIRVVVLSVIRTYMTRLVYRGGKRVFASSVWTRIYSCFLCLWIFSDLLHSTSTIPRYPKW